MQGNTRPVDGLTQRPPRFAVDREPLPLARGLRLGRLFGFEVRLDFSVLLILGVVVMNLGGGVFVQWHPAWSPLLRWSMAIAAAVLFFGSILAHELTHALVGRRVGVEIAGITLFLFGGLARLRNEPKRASAELWMAIAGPLVSIALGLVTLAVGAALATNSRTLVPDDPVALMRGLDPLATLLLWLGPLNVFLGVFNLLPGFPLDGGRVLRALVWWTTGDLPRATRVATAAGLVLAWGLIGIGVLMAFGFAFPIVGRGLVPGLWLMLIGWFLSAAARGSREQSRLAHALAGVPVERLMWRRVETVAPESNLESLVRDHFLHGDQSCFPVVSDGQLEGLVCLEDIRKIPEPSWAATSVEQVMTRAPDLKTVAPTSDAAQALELLGELEVGQLPVVEHGHLVGVLRRQEVLRWLTLRTPHDGFAPAH